MSSDHSKPCGDDNPDQNDYDHDHDHDHDHCGDDNHDDNDYGGFWWEIFESRTIRLWKVEGIDLQ